MAAHLDQQVVDAITTLVTGLTTTGSNVFKDHVYPFAADDLPCVSVTSTDESVEYLDIHRPREQVKRITVGIDAVAMSAASMMSTLRTIRKEVEIALATNYSLGGLAKSLKLISASTRMDVTGEQPVGVATMTYEIEVYCLETTPDVAL